MSHLCPSTTAKRTQEVAGSLPHVSREKPRFGTCTIQGFQRGLSEWVGVAAPHPLLWRLRRPRVVVNAWVPQVIHMRHGMPHSSILAQHTKSRLLTVSGRLATMHPSLTMPRRRRSGFGLSRAVLDIRQNTSLQMKELCTMHQTSRPQDMSARMKKP